MRQGGWVCRSTQTLHRLIENQHAREIAARTKPRFIEIPRERRRSVAYTRSN